MAKLTADQRRALARKAAAARWNTSKTATTSSNKNLEDREAIVTVDRVFCLYCCEVCHEEEQTA